MSEFTQPLGKVSVSKPKGKIKKVVLDLGRGDIMHVTFKVGNKIVLSIEATPGNMFTDIDIDGSLKREINFYTRTIQP